MTKDLYEQARVFFRTVGPQPDDEFIAVKNCTLCRPKHTTYRCKKCDFQTWEKWRMAVHISTDARRCNTIADKRAQEWAVN